MPDPDAKAGQDSTVADERPEPVVVDAVATTESYETDDGVVFYDADNPLAWVQTTLVFELDEVA